MKREYNDFPMARTESVQPFYTTATLTPRPERVIRLLSNSAQGLDTLIEDGLKEYEVKSITRKILHGVMEGHMAEARVYAK